MTGPSKPQRDEQWVMYYSLTPKILALKDIAYVIGILGQAGILVISRFQQSCLKFYIYFSVEQVRELLQQHRKQLDILSYRRAVHVINSFASPRRDLMAQNPELAHAEPDFIRQYIKPIQNACIVATSDIPVIELEPLLGKVVAECLNVELLQRLSEFRRQTKDQYSDPMMHIFQPHTSFRADGFLTAWLPSYQDEEDPDIKAANFGTIFVYNAIRSEYCLYVVYSKADIVKVFQRHPDVYSPELGIDLDQALERCLTQTTMPNISVRQMIVIDDYIAVVMQTVLEKYAQHLTGQNSLI